jgi:hypothetical protein
MSRVLVGLVFLLSAAPVFAQSTSELLDRISADAAEVKRRMGPPVVAVAAGGNVQAALDSAAPGTVIALSPGGTYQGPITLKDGKTLTTAAFDPAAPVRATIGCPDFQSAIRVEGAASIIGLHIQCNGNDNIYLTASANAVIEYNRVWGNGSAKNGITLNGQGVIRHNDIDYIYRAGQETHGILHTSGGPFLIDDNDIKAASINYLSGGDRVADAAAMPHDVTFTNNRLEKRIAWRSQGLVAKNFFELKMMRNLTAHHNTYRNSWQQGQAEGWCLSIGIRNQYGDNPFATVENVTMEDEQFFGCSGFLSVLGRDYSFPSQTMRNVKLRRITVNDFSRSTWGGSGKVFFIQGGPIDLVIEDLTVLKGAGDLNSLMTFTRPLEVGSGFVARRWDVPEGSYGIQHDGDGWGTTTPSARGAATLNWFLPGYVWESITLRRSPGFTSQTYPAGTTIVTVP